jgi:alcohol dehydrogenase YqhD (iron-dependent ADH family)
VWGAWAIEVYRDCLPRFCRYAKKVWGVTGGNDYYVAEEGIRLTVDYFASIGMPTSLGELGTYPGDEEIRALSLDATMNDTVKLSRIKPLGAGEVERIFYRAR